MIKEYNSATKGTHSATLIYLTGIYTLILMLINIKNEKNETE
jgi:hypothetical protein